MYYKLNPKYWFSGKYDRFLMELKSKHLDPYNNDLELLNYDYPTESEKETDAYKLRLNELKFKYGHIEEYSFELNKAKIMIKDELEFHKKVLEIDYKFHQIEEIDYLKQKATYNGKPFVAVRPNFDETDGDNFYLEIECNDLFLDKLKAQGYTGSSKDELLEQWLKWKTVSSFDDIESVIDANKMKTEIKRVDIDDNTKLYS